MDPVQPEDSVLAEVEIGPLVESDLAGISALITGMSADHARERLRDKSPAYYRWMYLDNPAGPAIVYSARYRGAVIASFAIAPKLLQVDGHQILIGKTMDMFTDPRYQGLGLIKRCTTAVFQDARRAGLAGWYVTPSVNSYPIFLNKWGYREEFELKFRVKVLDYSQTLHALIPHLHLGARIGKVINLLRSLTRTQRLAQTSAWTTTEIHHFDDDADRLWAEVASGYRVALVRDAAYLNWRYVQNPGDYQCLGLHQAGRLVGLVVLTTTLRRGIPVGEIVDYVCPRDDKQVFQRLLAIAADYFRHQQCALFEAWSVPGSAEDRRLRNAGLRMSRAEIKFLVSPDFPDEAIYVGDNWLLTQGDGNDV